MSTIEPNVVLATIAALLSLAVGAFVFFRGRSRRIGNTPHCPKCDYILHGNDRGTCPECGTEFTTATVVHGERPRRIGVAVTGAILMLIGLGLGGLVGSGIVSEIEWYHYRPFRWVMDDLDSNVAGVHARAWAELERRTTEGSLSMSQRTALMDRAINDLDSTNSTIASEAWPAVEAALNAGQLSEAQLDALVEHGLRRQLAPTFSPFDDRKFDLIAKRYADGKLSPSQKGRLFAGCTRLALKARPRIGPQEEVPYITEESGRGPQGWWMSMKWKGIYVDDRLIREGGGGSNGSISTRSIGSAIPKQAIGKHQLNVTMEVRISDGKTPDDPSRTALYKQTRTLTTPFEVLPDAVAIKLLDAPDSASISRCITANQFRLENMQGRQMNGMINVDAVPANIAFDVFARIDDRLYPLGTIAIAKGHACGFGVFCQKLPAAPFSKCDIVLRSSEKAAKSTLDLTEIWKGEIEIKGVTVQPPGKEQGAPPTSRSMTERCVIALQSKVYISPLV